MKNTKILDMTFKFNESGFESSINSTTKFSGLMYAINEMYLLFTNLHSEDESIQELINSIHDVKDYLQLILDMKNELSDYKSNMFQPFVLTVQIFTNDTPLKYSVEYDSSRSSKQMSVMENLLISLDISLLIAKLSELYDKNN